MPTRGSPDQDDFNADIDRCPYPVGRDDRTAARKPEREASAIAKRKAGLTGLRPQIRCDLRLTCVKYDDSQIQSGGRCNGLLLGQTVRMQLGQYLAKIYGADRRPDEAFGIEFVKTLIL